MLTDLSDFQITCSALLYTGQPLPTRLAIRLFGRRAQCRDSQGMIVDMREYKGVRYVVGAWEVEPYSDA